MASTLDSSAQAVPLTSPDGAPGRRADIQKPDTGRRLRTVATVIAILWLGLVLEAIYIALWPLSYDLTQGSDFSYEYLVQYPQVWEWFRPLLARFEELFPTAATSLEQLTT